MYYPQQSAWAAQAGALAPKIFHRVVTPAGLVTPVADPEAHQGVRLDPGAPLATVINAETPCWLGCDWSYDFDFGEYCVGRLELEIEADETADAPMRWELKFAECPYELASDFSAYHGGIGRGWLQEALLVYDEVPEKIALPRRYAFRYLRITQRGGSQAYKLRIKRLACITETSADWSAIPPAPAEMPELDRKIRDAGLRTLAACMQEFFEDGPKRDRRLWLGDLRLQALVNAKTFRNFPLVKRSLLYLAAASNDEGRVMSSCYPRGSKVLPNCIIYDYGTLFGDVVLDYYQASGDEEFAREMLPVAVRQCELALRCVEDGLFVGAGNLWQFIDWQNGLEKMCASQGVTIYGLARTAELAAALGDNAAAARWQELAAQMRTAAQKKWFDSQRGLFIDNGQISFVSQLWMAMAEVLSAAESAAALEKVIAMHRAQNAAPETVPAAERVVGPGGPYVYNQMVYALEKCGRHDAACDLTREYWGAMVARGCDTFWEIFVPGEPMRSPYGDCLINSCCHAWSTPVCDFLG